MEHKGYNSTVLPIGSDKAQQYKYQGQERQDELGLNWDSFKWRNYDYAIGRFFNIDPLAEKYAYQSPYNFSENRVVDAVELEGLECVLVHGTWAARDDKELYPMDKADYKGSTWQKGFSQKIATATGWNEKSTFEYTWSGENNTEARKTGGEQLAAQLMSDDNSFKDQKHATLVGHSHGGNVNKEAKNILEGEGWTVDIINIATPQRTDHTTGESQCGVYLNFYNDNDVVQYFGAKPETPSTGARIDTIADSNTEIETTEKKWFDNSGGHSYHNDPKAQKQILDVVEDTF